MIHSLYIRNYLLIAFRNILRQKGYSLINITGLAIGIMSCMLIVIYIGDELSYDRFHKKGEREPEEIGDRGGGQLPGKI